jgi:hypothetical protein
LTEEQFNAIPIPCKVVDGKFIPCDVPYEDYGNVSDETPEPNEVEQLRADIDYIAIMTGVEL